MDSDPDPPGHITSVGLQLHRFAGLPAPLGEYLLLPVSTAEVYTAGIANYLLCSPHSIQGFQQDISFRTLSFRPAANSHSGGRNKY